MDHTATIHVRHAVPRAEPPPLPCHPGPLRARARHAEESASTKTMRWGHSPLHPAGAALQTRNRFKLPYDVPPWSCSSLSRRSLTLLKAPEAPKTDRDNCTKGVLNSAPRLHSALQLHSFFFSPSTHSFWSFLTWFCIIEHFSSTLILPSVVAFAHPQWFTPPDTLHLCSSMQPFAKASVHRVALYFCSLARFSETLLDWTVSPLWIIWKILHSDLKADYPN